MLPVEGVAMKDFWQNHSDTFLTMAYLWDKRKVMQNPDGYATKKGVCGDSVAIYLAVHNDTIADVNFEMEGCLNTSACCNALAVLAAGKTVEESWKIGPKDIIDFLQTLPDDHHHCAELVAGTFYLALAVLHKNREAECDQEVPFD
jgi:nitrogen fixation protein NifU and related proteins